jgi:hypothetical protein
MKKERAKICSICDEPFTEYGNNAEPVNSGRCCDDCNWEVVLPARLVAFFKLPKGEKQ